MEEQNKNIEQQNQEPSVWKKNITWKNILIAFLPAVIIVSILQVMGIGGALVMAGVLFGVTYLVGSIRGKIAKK